MVVLHLHIKSETLMVSPSAFVLVCGTSKLINFDPLDVMLCLMFNGMHDMCLWVKLSIDPGAHLACNSTKGNTCDCKYPNIKGVGVIKVAV